MTNLGLFHRTYGSIPDQEKARILEGDEESQVTRKDELKRSRSLILLGCFVVAALVAMTGVLLNNTTATNTSERKTDNDVSWELSTVSLQARIDQWDQFKAKLGDWLQATENDSTHHGSNINTQQGSDAIWNTTVYHVKGDTKSNPLENSELWNATAEKDNHSLASITSSAQDVWNGTAEEPWNKTTKGIESTEDITVQVTEAPWNTTAHFSDQTVLPTSFETKSLWTKTAVKDTKIILNKTVHLAQHSEETTLDVADELWNRTKHGAEHFEDTVNKWFIHGEDETKEMWNETINTAEVDLHKGEHSIENWWNHTDSSVISWWQDRQRWWENKARNNTTQPAPALLYLNDTRSYALLTNGVGKWFDYSQDYFMYQQGWDAQINQAYCAVATSAALLNSLRGEIGMHLPLDPIYDPHPYATQTSLFNKCTENHVILNNGTYNGILHAPGGLGMPQTKLLLECWLPQNWTVTAYHVDPQRVSLDNLRQDLMQALQNQEARVVINYDRSSVHQLGGGHWSPLGSYSSERDAVLVMDVAKYKYPAVWIPLVTLYHSLSTFDVCGDWNFPTAQLNMTNKFLHPVNEVDYSRSMAKLGCKATRRGYIIVQRND